jgi:hypothetical protein
VGLELSVNNYDTYLPLGLLFTGPDGGGTGVPLAPKWLLNPSENSVWKPLCP